MRKSVWILIVVVLIVVAWVLATRRPDATIEVVNPKKGTLEAYIEEQAVTELPHDHLISMPISGWLEPITLREGDQVRAGDVVARLETHDLKDRVTQAEQRIAVLATKIEEVSDHRLERNALVEVEATVKAIDETVQAAEAKLEASRALMEFTRTEVKRISDLFAEATASSRELSEAQMEFRRSEAEFRGDQLELAALKTLAAVSYIGPKFIIDYIDRKSFTLEQHRKEMIEVQSQLEIEQRNLKRAEIQSPVDGVVLARHQTRHQYLAAGTPLLTVGQLDTMEVVAELLTERATRVQPGDAVQIYGQALDSEPIAGHVLRVYPSGFAKTSSLGVEQQRVKVAIALDARPPGLGIGFRVHVRIVYDRADDAIILPRTALFRSSLGDWQVMGVRNGRTELLRVSVGLRNEDYVQITDGLSSADRVVLRPSREIESGMRVAIAE